MYIRIGVLFAIANFLGRSVEAAKALEPVSVQSIVFVNDDRPPPPGMISIPGTMALIEVKVIGTASTDPEEFEVQVERDPVSGAQEVSILRRDAIPHQRSWRPESGFERTGLRYVTLILKSYDLDSPGFTQVQNPRADEIVSFVEVNDGKELGIRLSPLVIKNPPIYLLADPK